MLSLSSISIVIVSSAWGLLNSVKGLYNGIVILIQTHKPTQPRMPPISIGGGIGEQRGENKRMLVTLN